MNYEEAREYFKCQHCGECCVGFNAQGGGRGAAQILPLLKATGFPIPAMLTKESEMSFRIVLKNAPCMNYDQIGKRCMDYLGRPELCKQYFCEKSRIKDLPKDANTLTANVSAVASH